MVLQQSCEALCACVYRGRSASYSFLLLIAPSSATGNVGRMAPRIEMISKARRMAQGIDRGLDFIPCERGRLFSKMFSQTIPGALALALSALFGVWILYLRSGAPPYGARRK